MSWAEPVSGSAHSFFHTCTSLQVTSPVATSNRLLGLPYRASAELTKFGGRCRRPGHARPSHKNHLASMSKLDNYLRGSRKGAGLSQDQMAYLVGVSDGTQVSRYERFSTKPSLETALAYEAVL